MSIKRAQFSSVPSAKIAIHKIMKSEFDKSKQIAVLKQEFQTTYPARGNANNLTDDIFGKGEIGDDRVETQTRHTIYNIPKKMDAEGLLKAMEKFPKATIYRILSTDIDDVLTDTQKEMLASGRSSKSLEEYRDDKIVRDSDEDVVLSDDGQNQYRGLFFSSVYKKDVDKRVALANQVTEDGELISTERIPSATESELVMKPVAKPVTKKEADPVF